MKAGHRGDVATDDHNSLDTLTAKAKAIKRHGWKGALIAIRPGYWKRADFASAGATLDQLSGGRVRVDVVSGHDALVAYGDTEGDQSHRYTRTKEFMLLVRRLWAEENVTFADAHFQVMNSTVVPRFDGRNSRTHTKLYFGGASEAAERVAATEADVQLFWGEPLDGVRERIDQLKALSQRLDRDLPPLEFGLRITTLVRDTIEKAWAHAEAKVVKMAEGKAGSWQDHRQMVATGQPRLLNLAARGNVLDDNLYTAPGKF